MICVGEIRDEETAEIALRAAQTGHLVLATIHCDSNATALIRLLDLGVSPMLLSSGLNLLVSQRLMRKLCDQCKKPAEFSPAMIQGFRQNGIEHEEHVPARGLRTVRRNRLLWTGGHLRPADHHRAITDARSPQRRRCRQVQNGSGEEGPLQHGQRGDAGACGGRHQPRRTQTRGGIAVHDFLPRSTDGRVVRVDCRAVRLLRDVDHVLQSGAVRLRGAVLTPVIMPMIPAAFGYEYGVVLLSVAAATLLIAYGMCYACLSGQLQAVFPKAFDNIGAGILGFLTGFLVCSFVAFAVALTPVAKIDVIKGLELGSQSPGTGRCISYVCLWCDKLHSLVASSGAPLRTSEEATKWLLTKSGAVPAPVAPRSPELGEPAEGPSPPEREPAKPAKPGRATAAKGMARPEGVKEQAPEPAEPKAGPAPRPTPPAAPAAPPRRDEPKRVVDPFATP